MPLRVPAAEGMKTSVSPTGAAKLPPLPFMKMLEGHTLTAELSFKTMGDGMMLTADLVSMKIPVDVTHLNRRTVQLIFP